MANQKFYEAVLRDALPISRDYVDKGWPPLLYPWFLALIQLPDADKPAQKAFTLHMRDCIRAGALPAVRQRIPWFIENEVIEPHVTAQDFAAWLAREGVKPSPLVCEWFQHQGVADRAPAPAQTTAATPASELLLNAMPLPQEIRVSDAAVILGGGRLRENELMNLVATGALMSWSHSPKVGSPAEYTNHKLGVVYHLPRITDTTDPDSVLLDGEDVLWKWCVHYEQLLQGVSTPSKDSVENRREAMRELARKRALEVPDASVPGGTATQVRAAPATDTATPAPVADSASSAPAKKWTDEKLAELKAYRAAHTMPETAKKFGISEQRIRQLLPGDKPISKGYSAFTHR